MGACQFGINHSKRSNVHYQQDNTIVKTPIDASGSISDSTAETAQLKDKDEQMTKSNIVLEDIKTNNFLLLTAAYSSGTNVHIINYNEISQGCFRFLRFETKNLQNFHLRKI